MIDGHHLSSSYFLVGYASLAIALGCKKIVTILEDKVILESNFPKNNFKTDLTYDFQSKSDLIFVQNYEYSMN